MGFTPSEDDLRRWEVLGATFGPLRGDMDSGGESLGGKHDRKRHRPSHVDGVMNDSEGRYAEMLNARKYAGEILGWEFEPDVLVLSKAARCRFNPDFKVHLLDGTHEYHEVKNRARAKSLDALGGDSLVKIKWAAQVYAPVVFRLCVWRKGRWDIKEVPHD